MADQNLNESTHVDEQAQEEIRRLKDEVMENKMIQSAQKKDIIQLNQKIKDLQVKYANLYDNDVESLKN